ncbi:placenta growth factor isoform X1 [Monodelphis domestica]|uniref:placenta growth factor isoform X1 n=1 Tax=Monodelphis domestica TaxID=13616 RepID=UPI0024E23D06|nr:placenta growth factor isoform X1 [Monodelphis domestica]
MSAMRLFTCVLQLLAGLSLPAASPQQWDLSPENGTAEVEVLPFQEVWGRSFCRSLEKLVDVATEYPGEVEHMFSPSCVSLRRCTGCCGDENLHCVAVETTNVTMQLLKIKSGEQPSYMELAFTEHVRCECRGTPPEDFTPEQIPSTTRLTLEAEASTQARQPNRALRRLALLRSHLQAEHQTDAITCT